MKIINLLSQDSPPSKRAILGTLLIIAALTAIAYWPTLDADLLNWDDDVHLTDNYFIRSLKPANLKYIFTETFNGTYIPFTILTFAVEYHFFGYEPFVYHLNNLILHLLVTGLVFALGLQLGASLCAAGIGALIFGVHPIHVEAVAWVTARKDVLYGTFYLLALILYSRYQLTGNKKFYFGTIGCGFLSILAKPMGLSLPLILLVLDWFNRRKFSLKVLLEKIPFFLYAVPIAWITFAAHSREPHFTYFEGVLNWIWSFTFYLKKFFVPVEFVPLYQLPSPINLSNAQHQLAIFIFVVLLVSIVIFRKSRWYLFAISFYFASVFYMCRFIRFHPYMDKSVVADRYVYLAVCGFCLFLGVVINALLKKACTQKIFVQVLTFGGVLILCLLLTVKTSRQSLIWQDSLNLWNYVLNHSSNQAYAYNNKGVILSKQGQEEQALNYFEKALEIWPGFPTARINRAKQLDKLGQETEALRELNQLLANDSNDEAVIVSKNNKKIRIASNKALALNNRGVILRERGQHDLAMADFNRALRIDQNHVLAYNNRGLVYFQRKEYEQALEDYNHALQIDPDYFEALSNRGVLYDLMGQPQLAINDLSKALKIQPLDAEAHSNRGNWFRRRGLHDLAIKAFDRALEINPNLAPVYYNRSRSYLAVNNNSKAWEDALKAQELGYSIKDEYFEMLRSAGPR